MHKIDYTNLQDKEISIKINKTWKLFYNNVKNEIRLYNKEEEEDIILDSHDDKIVDIKVLNENLFISISLDKTIKTWNTRGNLISTFDLESDLLGIDFLNDDILLICKENTSLISKSGQTIFSIEENLESLEKVELWSDSLHFLSNNDLIVYNNKTGEKIIEFEDQNDFIKDFKKLANNNILTTTSTDGPITDKISLWEPSGKLIRVFDIVFDFTDVLETKENNLIILSYNKVYIFNDVGEKISSFEKDDLSEDLKVLITSFGSLKNHKDYKNDINQFPHISNPFSKVKIANEVLIEQELLDNKKFDKNVWDFFNRPLFSPVKKTLKKEENLAKKFIKKIEKLIIEKKENLKQLNENLTKELKSKNTNKWVSIVFFFLTLCTFGVTYGETNNILSLGLDKSILKNLLLISGVEGIIFLLFMMLSIRANTTSKNLKNDIEVVESELKTLDFIKVEVINFIGDVKKYRYSIIKQFPIVQDVTLFDGQKIEEKINTLLENDINKVAMNECGIIKDDIIHVDNKAIILNDWSLIQSNSKKINEHNMESYWGINKKILFATQFIQYIFLTKDKIDVFNTHYDFIQNKFIRKEAHAFYYKDVTNITKKEIEREIYGGAESAPATEITLKVSSGDSIDLTILNEETLVTLNSKIHNDDNEEKIDELEKQKEEIINDSTIDEEDKNDELELIEAQIQTLKSNASISNTQIDEFNKVDSTIQNIRAQIKIHKQ